MSIVGANSTISTYRLTAPEANKEEYNSTANLSDIGCYIEPASLDLQDISDNANAYSVHNCYIKGVVDIIRSDKIIDQDGNEYIVQQEQKFENNIDTDNQTELLLVKTYLGN